MRQLLFGVLGIASFERDVLQLGGVQTTKKTLGAVARLVPAILGV